jgi:hypothetical protein
MNSFTMFCFIMLLLGMLTAAQAQFFAVAAGITSAAAAIGLFYLGTPSQQEIIIAPPRFTKRACCLVPTTYYGCLSKMHLELQFGKASKHVLRFHLLALRDSSCPHIVCSICADTCLRLLLLCVLLSSGSV